jgi:hypothetical protein
MGYGMPDPAERAMELNSELNQIVGILKARNVELERLVEESSFVREAVLRGRVVYEKDSQ